MALKKSLTKAEYDALPAAFKTEYKASGEVFVLDIEGEDGIDWKQKREIEADHRKKAEAKAQKAQDELDDMRRGAIPKADVEALEGSWKTKLETQQAAHATELANRDAVIAATTVDSVAKDIAQIFTAPAIAIPMIRSRLKSEITNGVAITRVLDKNGAPSAMSVEDLKNEFKADTALAPVILASKASGGGAADGKGGEGGGGGAGKKLKDMGDKERKELYQRDPAEFRRLVAEQNSSK